MASQSEHALAEPPANQHSSDAGSPGPPSSQADAGSPSPVIISPASSIQFRDNFGLSTNDFPSLFEESTYVDKTAAMNDFLHAINHVQLLLRPRRSGKSIYLTMLK